MYFFVTGIHIVIQRTLLEHITWLNIYENNVHMTYDNVQMLESLIMWLSELQFQHKYV